MSHLVAALAPLIMIFVVRAVGERLRVRRFIAAFWRRQNRAALEASGIRQMPEIPPLFDVIETQRALQTVLQAMAFVREHGLVEFLEQHPGATDEEIADHMGFSLRQVRAGIELMRAARVIENYDNGYAITAQARVYLSHDSAMLDFTLPPPQVSKTVLKILRSGLVPGPVAKWVSGRVATPRVWAAGMHRISFPLGFALHRTGVLDGAKRLLDVAGGAGSVCIALALENPSFELELIELPGSVELAERMRAQYELADRIQCHGMDMFESEWPGDFDTVLFTNIFHDWDDERCRTLASKAYSALRPGGKIFLQEALLHEEKPGPLWTAHFSMNMALLMQGKQFRASELSELLQGAGFEDVQVRPLLGYYSTIWATKPDARPDPKPEHDTGEDRDDRAESTAS